MKKIRLLLIMFLLAGCDMNDGSKNNANRYQDAVNVFILAGQSNMEGQSLESCLPGYLSDNNLPSDIYKNGFEDVRLSFVGKENQTNDDKPLDGKFVTTKLGYGASKLRFGPEIGLAEEISNKSAKPTYLIKFTYSGAGFYGTPNFMSPSSDTAGKLYTDMIDFIIIAILVIIVGFLFCL